MLIVARIALNVVLIAARLHPVMVRSAVCVDASACSFEVVMLTDTHLHATVHGQCVLLLQEQVSSLC